LRQSQRHPDRDQSLLSTVMEITLEANPLFVADLQQPPPAGFNLVEGAVQLDPQPDDLDQRRGMARNLCEQLGERERPSRDGADLLVSERDRSRVGQVVVDNRPVGVGVRCRVGNPVRHPQLRVGERGLQQHLQLLGPRSPGDGVCVQLVQGDIDPLSGRIEPPVNAPLEPTPQRQDEDGAQRRGRGGRRWRRLRRHESDGHVDGGEHRQQSSAEDGVGGGRCQDLVDIEQMRPGDGDRNEEWQQHVHRGKAHRDDNIGLADDEIAQP
jgi:hypothetical protein